MSALLALSVLVLIAAVIVDLQERRAARLESLNRESWELLQAARRIHDEAASAIQAMLDEALEQARETRAAELEP